jgi:antirestriction protein ArdC
MSSVAEIIVKQLIDTVDQTGLLPWQRPWTSAGRPRNVSGRPYRGINTLLLATAGYEDPRWLTFRQAKELGGFVRAGEHGMPVVFWKQTIVSQQEDDEGEPITDERVVPVLRYYTVFNVAQCEGLRLPPLVPWDPPPVHEMAEMILATIPQPPAIRYDGGDRAYYDIRTDTIHVPSKAFFRSATDWYQTLFHELVHATGHPKRLNRDGISDFDHFGSGRYAREELIAEIGSAILLAEAGLSPSVANSAAYLASWLKVLRSKRNEVIVAAGHADRAVSWLLERGERAVA